MKATDGHLKAYLVKEFSTLLRNKNLYEWIDSHVERNETRATRSIIEAMTLWIDAESQ